MTDNEEWNRQFVLDTLRETVREALDGGYEDEAQVFFDVRRNGESLVVTVTDGTDESLSEDITVSFN